MVVTVSNEIIKKNPVEEHHTVSKGVLNRTPYQAYNQIEVVPVCWFVFHK